MTETYFKNFPQIEYANTSVVDITRRAKTVDSLNSNPFIYYPYIIENNERHDQIADKFWKDFDLGWLLMMSNQIIDPYYQWYLQDNEFYDFIIKKYGSYENAQKIKLFRVIDSTEIISTERYNELAPIEYKYWEPTYQSVYNLSGYTRKKLTWSVNTNMVIKYILAVEPEDINVGDKIKIKITASSFGTAEVVSKNNNILICNNIQDDAFDRVDLILNPTSYLYVNTQYIINSIIIINKNITEDEYKYWEPITFLQWEQEQNEYNKTLRIMNPAVVPGTVQQFKDVIK